MDYISCFSGIGGLEYDEPPLLLCEIDEVAQQVLRSLYPDTELWADIRTLQPPKAEVVAGGWPCQDLSIAGHQAGLSGLRSGLLLDLLRAAELAGADTVVAENVTNLLRLRAGREFAASLQAFAGAGFRHVSWRTLNARHFGLPQNRSRVIIIASKQEDVALTLFRDLPPLNAAIVAPDLRSKAAGFYWTGGTHSINYSRGYVPTIKVGSSVGIISPPAVHYDRVVRKLSAAEALALQGFQIDLDVFPSASSAYKAAGNAVPRPMGRWVMSGVANVQPVPALNWLPVQGDLFDAGHVTRYPSAGLFSGDGTVRALASEPKYQEATDLVEYLDLSSTERLSSRASKGLLERLHRSGQSCPEELKDLLVDLSSELATSA